jgi:uncharacterized protein YbjQ (UPF0145 family)
VRAACVLGLPCHATSHGRLLLPVCRYAEPSAMGPPDSTLRGNELPWPKHNTLEYAIHGKFHRSADDSKGLHSAFWVPMKKLVLSLGKELVNEKLKEYEEEARRVREEAIDECVAEIAEEEADAAVAAERAAARAASGGAAGGAAARAAAGATGATSPEMA